MSRCEECDKASLEKQVDGFRELIEVAQSVVSTIDLDSVLQSILLSAMKFAATPAGSIALYEIKRNELTLHTHAGLSAAFVKNERWEVKPGGLTEQTLKADEVQCIEDTAATSYFDNPIAEAEGIKSVICIPLKVHGGVVGILYLDDFVPRRFDPEKLQLLVVLGSVAALAVYNAKLHTRTRLLAITDALTGLHNHRYFQEMFEQELERAKRYEKPLSLVLLDVDDFKKFNDVYGHADGDRILATIGKIITKTLRRVDFAFRYGGEEFVVLLPETRLESALQVAERLRERIETETATVLPRKIDRGVTVSVGAVFYPGDGTTREELFDAVDRLLYRAKETGKNRVYFTKENGAPLSPSA